MAVTEATEVVAEVAEHVADQADNVAEVARAVDGKARAIGLGIGLVGGAVVAYMYANKRLRDKYEQITQEEIDEMREHFRKRALVKEEKPDLAAAVDQITEREGYSSPQTPVIKEDKDEAEPEEEADVRTVGASEEEPQEEDEVEASAAEVNVFEKAEKEADEGWDYEHEVSERLPGKPYIIHVDEQHEHEGYTEMSLIYYAGDDVLCDYHDTPVDDKEKVAGEANLEKFGHGSGDPNIVYVRNDALEIEMEIVKNEGSYAEVVHGFRHGEYGPTRKVKRFDDDTGTG
jgi:hypothetical protein